MSTTTSSRPPVVLILGELAIQGPKGTRKIKGPVEAHLLATLLMAAEQGSELTTDDLNEQVWSGSSTAQGVYTAVFRLQKKLREVGVTDGISGGATYRLNADSDLAFAGRLLREAQQAIGEPEAAMKLLDEASALWRGKPLGRLEEWRLEDLKRLADGLKVEIALERAELSGRTNGAHAEASELRHALKEVGVEHQSVIYRRLIAAQLNTEGPARARAAFEEACDKLNYDSGHMPDEFYELLQRINQRERQFSGDEGLDFLAPERHSYSNVPGPTYTRFVARRQDSERLRIALDGEKPIVAVTAIGGRGKTSLVNHFVRHLTVGGSPRFFAVVWVSDETDPGATTLATVIDELAKTVNEPRLSQAAPDAKEHLARTYLQAKGVLFVIDNFQSITDRSVGEFLTRLPDGSKAIITTTREDTSISRFVTPVDILRPPEGDPMAREFLSAMLEAANIGDMDSDDPGLHEIWELADGNLRLVELALGLLKRRGFERMRSLLSGAHDADTTSAAITEDVLHTSFTGLGPAVAQVLHAAACYPEGATWDTVQQISALPESEYEAAVEETIQSRFLREAPERGMGILRIEPLVAQHFAPGRCKSPATNPEIEARWLEERVETASRIGFCPDDLSRLSRLDNSVEFKNLEYALRWMRNHGAWATLLSTARGLYFYYYVRGLWSADPNPFELWTLAASELGDRLSEFESLVVRANIGAKQSNGRACDELFARLQTLEATLGEIPEPLLGKYRHALALRALNRRDFAAARSLWELNLDRDSGISNADYNANLRWFTICLGAQNDPETRVWLERSRDHSSKFGFDRALARTNLEIAKHDLNMPSAAASSNEILAALDSLEPAITSLKDPIYHADYLETRAQALRRLGFDEDAEVLEVQAQSLRDRVPYVSISEELA